MSKNSLTAYAASGNLPTLDADSMARALAGVIAEESTGSASDGVEYVSFSGKTGAITYGRDKHDLPQNELFLMEPRSAFRGWVCWKDNKPVARHQWSIYQPQLAIPESQLEDKGPYSRQQDGWQSMLGFGFVATDGADQFSFSTNSASGKNAVTDFFNEIAQRTVSGEPNFPLFYFTREKFEAKGEWNFKPKFDVDEWLTEEEAMAMLEGEEAAPAAEPEPAPEPAPRLGRTRRT